MIINFLQILRFYRKVALGFFIVRKFHNTSVAIKMCSKHAPRIVHLTINVFNM